MSGPALEVAEVSASHSRGTGTRQVLAPLSFSLPAGQTLAITGESGAGKSTLAEIILGLRPPATGQVKVHGEAWVGPRRPVQLHQRRLVQGVPQDPSAAFVPRWSIRASMAQAISRLVPGGNARELISMAAQLAQLEMALLDRRPQELSGGQLQRAALARAVAVQPHVLVADEPTSALDPRTAEQVATQLFSAASLTGTTLLLVTHDPQLAARCSRTIDIHPPQRRITHPRSFPA
ncbi:ATP-binding cassette domain-containing protein [Glutamicibacter arilaitensis]|jgi:peptide/nickel transport system ATP-binding protein|uniref:ABC transporter ATP-binding protein n=3 Tax=Glutamicibacter TaxID=1742989 RepID=A0A2N7RXR7_9MICC|nr:ATP-binding cassette domain-containing protein [Glutamicibacter arilaitensis]PMQ18689.1 ABC transporter ATP-binding protein [Glutamicibacter arilaitensis]